MIDISDSIKQKILSDSIGREIILKFPDLNLEIDSNNIVAESFELKQSICDEKEFTLGGCVAGQMSIQIFGIDTELANATVNVYLRQGYADVLYPADTLLLSNDLKPSRADNWVEYQLFSGVVDSVTRQKNRAIKELVAYDAMYKASNKIPYGYASDLAIHSPTVMLRDFIYSIGINIDPNFEAKRTDNFNISNTISFTDLELVKKCNVEKVSVVDWFKAFCELNSTFGYVNRQGELAQLKLYDTSAVAKETITSYSSLTFEDYVVQPINLIKFAYNKDSYFEYGNSGQAKQSWYISDNIITKCCTNIGAMISRFMSTAGGTNYIFGSMYSYRPFEATLFAQWWLEPGDKVTIPTGYEDVKSVESFVLSRTIKGVNGMTVTIESKGKEYAGKDEVQ